MLGLSRTDVINDDLGLFDSVSTAFGKMAARKMAGAAYTTLMGNSGSFFRSDNSNALTAALSYSAIGSAITAMQTQRDDEGNDLDIRPATLVVSPELRDTATAAIESEHLQRLADSTATAVDTYPTGNPSRQSVKLEVEPRLSNTDKFTNASKTQWFLFAPPSDAPMIAAFLDGIQTPRIEFFGLDHDVNALGVHWRIYQDFGYAYRRLPRGRPIDGSGSVTKHGRATSKPVLPATGRGVRPF